MSQALRLLRNVEILLRIRHISVRHKILGLIEISAFGYSATPDRLILTFAVAVPKPRWCGWPCHSCIPRFWKEGFGLTSNVSSCSSFGRAIDC